MSAITSEIGKSGLYPAIPAGDVEDVEKLSPIQELPEEILLIIFGYLSLRDQDTARCVCRKWKVVGNDKTLKEIRAFAFGATKWKRYFGDVGIEPPLPDNIFRILRGPCPFWPDKKVRETHLLTLIPQTINTKPLSLDALGTIIQKPKSGHATKYRYYNNDVKKEHGNTSPSKSYWVLMTRDVIPGSRNKRYEAQKKLMASHAEKSGEPYALPKLLLEATTAILMHHVETGKRLYSDQPWTYTRCQEKVEGNQWPVAIGGFAAGGLVVNLNYYDYVIHGVSGARKLPPGH